MTSSTTMVVVPWVLMDSKVVLGGTHREGLINGMVVTMVSDTSLSNI